MKKWIVLCAAAVAAAVSNAASISASQPWVRLKIAQAETNMHSWVKARLGDAGVRVSLGSVVTNADDTVTFSGPCNFPDVPRAAWMSLTFAPNDTQAICLSESTIPGCPTMAYYAWDGSGYANVGIAALPKVYSANAMSTVITTNDTSGVISTNTYAYTDWSAFAEDGTKYLLAKDSGNTYLQAETNAAWRARLSRAMIARCVADSLVGARSAVVLRSASPSPRSGDGDDEDTKVTLSLVGGTVHYEDTGEDVPIVFPSPMVLTLPDFDLPEMPSSEHVHDIDPNNNCRCADGGRSVEDIKSEAEAEYPNLQKDDMAILVDPEQWIGNDWPQDWSRTMPAPGGGTRTIYQIVDAAGSRFNLTKLGETDYWLDVVSRCIEDTNGKMAKRREAYIKSKTCTDPDTEHHDWYTQTCGGNSWKICRRNGSHKEGEESHTGHVRRGGSYTCNCGLRASPHQMTEGTKNAKSGNTGWTRTDYCVLGCGYTTTLDHDCVHEKCRVCSAGDDCDWPCPTCNGQHDFDGAPSAGHCVRCECENCGLTEREAGKPLVRSHHTGWDSCHRKDDDDDWSNGAHCCCECGSYSHKNGSDHERDNLDEPRYQVRIDDDTGEEDATYHWMIDKTECKYCHDPYGVLDEHDLGDEDEAHFQKIDNTYCAKRVECKKNCGYRVYQTVGGEGVLEAGEHVEDEEVEPEYTNFSEEICRKWMTCRQCKDTFYSDEEHEQPEEPDHYEYVSDEDCMPIYICAHNGCDRIIEGESGSHDLSQEPVRYENISAAICRAVRVCQHSGCGHEIYEDGAHVRDTSNGCLCQNGCGYQFEHVFDQTDACGNRKCACGAREEGEESHTGHVLSGGDYKCLCGKTLSPHVWGEWQVTSEDENFVYYARLCTLGCNQRETRRESKVAHCVNGEHVLNPETPCTCYCGKYSPSNPASDEDLHTFETTADNTGYAPCRCSCGKKHKFREASNPNSDTVCPNVCAYCGKINKYGETATAEDHAPSVGHYCGCKCQKYTSSADDARFHIRMPGKCVCWGAAGANRSDGSGGKRRWRMARNDCTRICACDFGGKKHLVASEDGEIGVPLQAQWSDHTGKTSGACGCKCGEYSGATLTAVMVQLHNTNGTSSCGCVCGALIEPHKFSFNYSKGKTNCQCDCLRQEKKVNGRLVGIHNMENDGECVRVCHGTCGESKKTTADFLAAHTPDASRCGCECMGDRTFSRADIVYPNDTYPNMHSVVGNPKCWCECHYYHKFPMMSPLCLNVCTNCWGDARGQNVNSENIHTYRPTDESCGYCGCECGKFVGDWHRHAADDCYCYAKNHKDELHTRVDLNHDWGDASATGNKEDYECPVCGEQDQNSEWMHTCKRCGKVETWWVIGHECHDEGSETYYCACESCVCEPCKRGYGACTSCGKQCTSACKDRAQDSGSDGGSTGDQTDDPWNIK